MVAWSMYTVVNNTAPLSESKSLVPFDRDAGLGGTTPTRFEQVERRRNEQHAEHGAR